MLKLRWGNPVHNTHSIENLPTLVQNSFCIQFQLKTQIHAYDFFQHNLLLQRWQNVVNYIHVLTVIQFNLQDHQKSQTNILGQNFFWIFLRPVTALEKVVFTVWDAVRSAICRGEECCCRGEWGGKSYIWLHSSRLPNFVSFSASVFAFFTSPQFPQFASFTASVFAILHSSRLPNFAKFGSVTATLFAILHSVRLTNFLGTWTSHCQCICYCFKSNLLELPIV